MFAVVKTGGKQYKVAEGDVITVEKLEGEAGNKVDLDQVLAVGGDKPQVGAPLVAGAVVNAEIVSQGKGEKVIVFKKKRRHNYRRKLGHRQLETKLKVTGISVGGKKAAAPKKEEAKAETKKAAPAEKKAAPKKTEAKKAEPKKTTAKKADTAKKAAPKKTAAKKTTEKKAAPKKTAAKKTDKE